MPSFSQVLLFTHECAIVITFWLLVAITIERYITNSSFLHRSCICRFFTKDWTTYLNARTNYIFLISIFCLHCFSIDFIPQLDTVYPLIRNRAVSGVPVWYICCHVCVWASPQLLAIFYSSIFISRRVFLFYSFWSLLCWRWLAEDSVLVLSCEVNIKH